ncbi:M23 family metallopeptidase [Oceanobacillus jeddahense]|uniref:M23 family metallopeptidase n=1 Tax=Oceanobacillus jeddahense TaxID=1462527 RepID=A0ABY5K129_9BACI|nr:M23 family metallopeptidase [Oceanobacillus jeddahense]UUI05337.1 M23 family metallopeptidase [Oceanobacillus jeddahense]
MDKNLKKIRKAIEMRQKAKGLNQTKQKQQEDYLQSNALPDMEESHGFYPSISASHTNSAIPENNSRVTNIAVKALLSVSLFLGTAFVTEIDRPFMNQPKEWLTSTLTNQFPFAKVNAWYSEAFGAPLSFSPSAVTEEVITDSSYLPVNGIISEHFHENGQGIYIEVEGEENVAAVQEGIVVFAGNDRSTNKTVKIQHADGTTTQYGFLDSIEVHLYQHISNGQVLGTLGTENDSTSVFFAIEQENQYIDPEQVILVDQQP